MTPSDQPREAGEGRAAIPTREELKKLFDRHNNKYYAMAADDWKEHASYASVKRHYDESIKAEGEFLHALDRVLLSHASDQAKIKGLREALEDSNNHLSALLAIFRHKLPPATERSIELRIGKNRRAALKQSQP